MQLDPKNMFIQIFLSISNAGYPLKYAMLKNQFPQFSAESASNNQASITTEIEVDVKHMYFFV